MAAFVDRYWNAADGLRLYARDYGAGGGEAGRLPVFCLHGLTRNSRDFEDVAPMVAATGRRVLAVDVRGRGRSEYAPNPFSYAVPIYAQDVLMLMQAMGVERAAFIGTSMGGLIAMTLAAMAPHAVAGVLLNDVGPEIAPEGLARILGYAGGQPDGMSWDAAVAYCKAANGIAFPAYEARDWEAFARRLFRETAAGFVLDYDPAIMAPLRPPPASSPPAGPAPDLWPLFANMAENRTVALVRGALSDVLSRPLCERMQALAPHMLFGEVEEVGHAPMLTEPAAQGVMSRWLERLG
jgi:pimeloyl-ACP methyl ester carboxylesterase